MTNILDTWREKRRIAHARRQLHGLSDHILHDIGLTRASINSGVQEDAKPHHGRSRS
ncbi:MAG: DUF1127 domain-containing protein [Candidatus Devosia phytovorans]|uniref:DUF1127 domain-containing protein n=1 Tax=Candidatus Devosia phytovorans TaxID=3121372 RepID=A0AAJ6B2C7_9HYPH|nr:DUF1127 domain-containing protein [Devosia sp.]WEK06561.1 MAG: DUF1127 domain-containing protein [Devosia sp.]